MNSTLIVYFVYINPNVNWRKLILTQLKDIEKSGILQVSDLHIIVSNPSKVEDVEGFFENKVNLYKEIQFFYENRFEYWALHHLWKVLNINKNYDYCVYMHTKGMSYAKRKRNVHEKILTYYTCSYFEKCIKIFKEKQSVNKIGLFPANHIDDNDGKVGGWIWFNFWWARSSYIRNLEEPIITDDRYYYEGWLSKIITDDDPLIDCYSLYPGEPKTLFTGADAIELIKKLRYKVVLEKIKKYFFCIEPR